MVNKKTLAKELSRKTLLTQKEATLVVEEMFDLTSDDSEQAEEYGNSVKSDEPFKELAEKVLSFDGLHEETIKFAKDIIKNQKSEIEFMKNWIKKAGSSR